MKTLTALAVVFCAGLPASAMAQTGTVNAEVKTGPIPDWVSVPPPIPATEEQGGVAFVRSSDTEAHLDAEGQTTFQSYRIKLLQPNALALGNVALEWNPAAGGPVVHWLRIHRDGTERDVLAETSFDVLQREKDLEAAALSGVLTAVLRVPDLRVGDELDFAYSLRQVDPTMGKDSSGVLFLAPNPAPGLFRLRLSWDDGAKPNIQLSPDLEPKVEKGKSSVTIDFDDPGPANPPKGAPPRFAWQRIAEFSDFPTWSAVSERFEPLFAKATSLSPDSPLKAEAARIAAANSSPLARAAAALKLVQQQVRYVYVGLNEGGLTPAGADETWQRRYGDCKGKTALLLALLDELGIEAKPVLANNSGGDDGFDQRLPNPGLFDHVLVQAQIDGKQYWLDGTLPQVVPPTLEPSFPYRWVLPITSAGASLAEVPWSPMEHPDTLVVYDIDAGEGFDKPAKITTTTISRGPAALTEYLSFSALSAAQLENAIRQNSEGNGSWDTIDSASWRYDVPTQASVLTISGTGPLEWEDEGNGARELILPGGGFSPPERRGRSSEQDQDAPYYNQPEYDCRITTVRFPRETRAPEWTYNSFFITKLYGSVYRRWFHRGDREITMLRQTRVLTPEISSADVKADNVNLPSFDNSMARITHYPGSSQGAYDNGPLPPAYDHDWVADDRICMEPNLPVVTRVPTLRPSNSD